MTNIHKISVGQKVIYCSLHATVKQVCAYSIKIVSPLLKEAVWVPISQIKLI